MDRIVNPRWSEKSETETALWPERKSFRQLGAEFSMEMSTHCISMIICGVRGILIRPAFFPPPQRLGIIRRAILCKWQSAGRRSLHDRER